MAGHRGDKSHYKPRSDSDGDRHPTDAGAGRSVASAGEPPDRKEVVVLRWPVDEARLGSLAAAGVPRLVLVPPGEQPPESDDCLQDWVRLPCDTQDVDARLDAVSRRAKRHPSRPRVDDHGRLIYKDMWISLSPIEERISRVLVDRFGDVVSDPEIASHAWGSESFSGNALRVQLTRLRRNLEPLGLEIRVVYKRGHVMQVAGRP